MNNNPWLRDRRVWLVGGAVVAVLLVAASWFMLISPKLASADDLGAQRENAETQNVITAGKNSKLARQARDLASLQDKLSTALDGLPATSGLASFTKEVTAQAAAAGVTLTAITITSPTATTSAAGAPVTAPTGSVTTPTTAASNILTIPVTLSTTGTLSKQTAFLRALHDGARRTLVSSSQLSVAGNSRVNSVDATTTSTTQLTIFSSPMTPAQMKAVRADLATQ